MPNNTRPLIDAAAQYRAALARNERGAQMRLINAYKSLSERLQSKIDALLLEIGDGPITRGQLVRMERYQALLRQAAEELASYQALTRAELEAIAQYGIASGARDARNYLSITATGTPGIAAQFNTLPKGTIETLLGFLDTEGPLYARLKLMAPTYADLISKTILDSVGLGYNPRKTARMLNSALGMPLTDSLRMMRTVQLWSYREANRATYLANADLLDGWIWYAELDDAVCMSCVAQHGTVHPLDEPLDDHHNGRCAPIPLVKGFDALAQPGDGEKWFTSQSETAQRAQMGRGKFDAWQAGKFEFSALSTQKPDDVYGQMRVEAVLKDLLGD